MIAQPPAGFRFKVCNLLIRPSAPLNPLWLMLILWLRLTYLVAVVAVDVSVAVAVVNGNSSVCDPGSNVVGLVAPFMKQLCFIFPQYGNDMVKAF